LHEPLNSAENLLSAFRFRFYNAAGKSQWSCRKLCRLATSKTRTAALRGLYSRARSVSRRLNSNPSKMNNITETIIQIARDFGIFRARSWLGWKRAHVNPNPNDRTLRASSRRPTTRNCHEQYPSSIKANSWVSSQTFHTALQTRTSVALLSSVSSALFHLIFPKAS
jgi:hypothetical protein